MGQNMSVCVHMCVAIAAATCLAATRQWAILRTSPCFQFLGYSCCVATLTAAVPVNSDWRSWVREKCPQKCGKLKTVRKILNRSGLLRDSAHLHHKRVHGAFGVRGLVSSCACLCLPSSRCALAISCAFPCSLPSDGILLLSAAQAYAFALDGMLLLVCVFVACVAFSIVDERSANLQGCFHTVGGDYWPCCRSTIHRGYLDHFEVEGGSSSVAALQHLRLLLWENRMALLCQRLDW